MAAVLTIPRSPVSRSGEGLTLETTDISYSMSLSIPLLLCAWMLLTKALFAQRVAPVVAWLSVRSQRIVTPCAASQVYACSRKPTVVGSWSSASTLARPTRVPSSLPSSIDSSSRPKRWNGITSVHSTSRTPY